MLPYASIISPYGLNVPINFTRMRRIYTCLRVFVSVSVFHPLCPWFLLFLFLNTVPINSSSKGHVLGKGGARLSTALLISAFQNIIEIF